MATRYKKWRAACAHIKTVEARAEDLRIEGVAEKARLLEDANRLQDEGLRALAMDEAERRGNKAVQSANTKADRLEADEMKEIRKLQPPTATIRDLGIQISVDEETGNVILANLDKFGKETGDAVGLTADQALAIHAWITINMCEVPAAEAILQGRN